MVAETEMSVSHSSGQIIATASRGIMKHDKFDVGYLPQQLKGQLASLLRRPSPQGENKTEQFKYLAGTKAILNETRKSIFCSQRND